jgi:centrosomal protein CEP170
MEESCSGGALVPNNNHSFTSNEIQWIIVSKRDGKTKLLPRGMIFVGREECDIILSSTTVDKRHAVIFFNTTNEQFHVKDLNSSYGVCYLKSV